MNFKINKLAFAKSDEKCLLGPWRSILTYLVTLFNQKLFVFVSIWFLLLFALLYGLITTYVKWLKGTRNSRYKMHFKAVINKSVSKCLPVCQVYNTPYAFLPWLLMMPMTTYVCGYTVFFNIDWTYASSSILHKYVIMKILL